MKHIKKIIICLLAVFVLVGNQTTYVSAAAETAASARSNPITVTVSKDSAKVEVYFSYVDGSNVNYTGYKVLSGMGTYTFAVTHNAFSGDTRTVKITATKANGTTVTLGAWCDVYGQYGTF